MAYEIIEIAGLYPYTRKTVLHRADTLDNAIKLARATYDVIDLEIDHLHPGYADFYTRAGQVLSIEPKA